MKSYIKIYGPPIDKALTALEDLVEKLPSISKGEISEDMLPRGVATRGDFDFAFEWAEDPTEEKLRVLIHNIDEILADLGCRYTIVTK